MAATIPTEPRRNAPDAVRSLIRRYWIVWALYGLAPSFIFAVYPLFLRARGLNQFQTNTVAASYLVVMFLTDVPTGAFADAVGRRAATVIGCAIHVAAFLLYFVSHHYWQFIIAEVLEGFGTTFANGPIDAWMVDALDAAGFQGPKDIIFSRQFQLMRITAMSGALVGAYVAQIDIALPFLLGTFAWTAAATGAFILMERGAGRRRPTIHIAAEIRRRAIDSARLGFAERSLRLLSIAGLISASVWTAWWLEWQVYFTRGFDARISIVGWIFVAITLMQMAGAEIAARAPLTWERRPSFVAAMSMIASAALIVAGIAGARMWFALAAVMLIHLASGAIGPMYAAWYNESIEGENRATLLSFGSTMATLGGTVGQPVQGKLVDVLGVGVTWQLAGLVSMAQVPCYIALGRSRFPREA